MTKTLSERANRCHEDFRAMVGSMERTTTKLQGRFVVEIALAGGGTIPLAGSSALDMKFGEYLERAKEKLLEKQQQLGLTHADYTALLASLPSAIRRETENRITVRAWSAAKGPFLEALCLLADLHNRQSASVSTPLRLFAPAGPIRVFEGEQALFIWSQPKMSDTRSRMNACPDIVITTEATISPGTVVAIRECKCHRRIPSDELRKECGKAFDLQASSYVIVSYYRVTAKRRRGAAGLGLKIEEIGLDTPERGEYVRGERDLAEDLAQKLREADNEAGFRKGMEEGAATAREKERGR
jgi:hypothetical protein